MNVYANIYAAIRDQSNTLHDTAGLFVANLDDPRDRQIDGLVLGTGVIHARGIQGARLRPPLAAMTRQGRTMLLLAGGRALAVLGIPKLQSPFATIKNIQDVLGNR